MSGYWEHLARARLTRRRALASAAIGTAFAAVTLAGCGGDEKEEASGLVAKPVDTTHRAERGGIFKNSVVADTASFEPIESVQLGAVTHAGYVYSRLLKYRVGTFDKLADGSTEPDAAESFEVSSDGLQYTFHLRANLPYDSRPPTNGRPLDAADVKFSWDRLVAIGRSRSNLVNSVNAEAPVVSVSAPDPRTVIFKLAFPYAPFAGALAFPQNLFLLPREADGKFDPRVEMRGSGAFSQSRYTPSAGYEYRRNPDWYVKDRPFLDGHDLAIISEYSQGLAQLKAGNLWYYPVVQPDVVQTKRDVPELTLMKIQAFPRVAPMIYFGLDPKGRGAGSPFFDDRVRKAMSILIDRDLWIETFYNVSSFAADGLPLETRWHSHVYAGEEAYWLNPQGGELGEASTFFKHDPGEARKLLQAAGYTNAIPGEYTYITSNQFGGEFPRQAEVLREMFQANGDFEMKVNNPTFNDFAINYNRSNGNFDGISMTALSPYPDIDIYLRTIFQTGGTLQMFPQGDPEIERLIRAQRQEPDSGKRAEIIRQFQRYAATKFYTIPFPGHALGFYLMWPWVGNRGVFNSWDPQALPQEAGIHTWYDKSKKPA
jgi:ABC-type transport system substrate-binding protein